MSDRISHARILKAMTTPESDNLSFFKLAAYYYPAMLRGALLGSIIGLAVPTAANFLRVQRDQSAGLISRAVMWPNRRWLFLLVILSLVLLLYSSPVLSFGKRLLASWRVKPTTGLFLIWLLSSPYILTLISEEWYVPAMVVFLISVALCAILLVWVVTREISAARGDTDSDVPIETWDQDILRRRDLVSKLTEEVATGTVSVIALVGTYGDGKTSCLNLLQQDLRKHYPDVVIVPFVSSLATSEEVLVGTLFNSIAKELQKRFVHDSLPGGLRQYASSLVGVVPRFGSAVKELFQLPSQGDQIQRLKDSIESLGVRVVVVLDDMDRMHTKELELLLKLMRGTAEFQSLIYVCAFDKEALARDLSGGRMELDEARNYLEKFFPVQTPLPKIDVTILSGEFDKRFEMFRKRYGLLATEQEQKRFYENFGHLWQVRINRCFPNLRRIKMFFNRLTTAVGPIVAEINLMDFILLEIIRDIAPEIHESIYIHRRYFFQAKWLIETWGEALSSDDNEEKKLRGQFLDELLQPFDSRKRVLIIELLAELFPAVSEYHRRGMIGSLDSFESKKERRIYHPTFFARYFIFGVQSDQFGEAEFNGLISELDKCNDIETCKNRFKQEFETLPAESLRRRSFLDQLATKIDRFGALQAEAVAIMIAELSDRLEPPVLGLAEAETARRVIFAVANQFANTTKVQDFLEATIRAASADYFAALILVACEDPNKNQILTKWDNVNLDRLRGSFRERMKRKYFTGDSASIFEAENQKGAIRSLFLWKQAGGIEEIRSYLNEEFGKRPQSLGIFLSFMFPMEGSATLEQLKALSDLQQLDELEAWANTPGAAAHSSAEEESAIARFRSILASARLAKLRFKMPENQAWTATNEDGSILTCFDGQVIPDVKLAEDGIPAKQNLREAVTAGMAEIIPPPSWAGTSSRGKSEVD